MKSIERQYISLEEKQKAHKAVGDRWLCNSRVGRVTSHMSDAVYFSYL